MHFRVPDPTPHRLIIAPPGTEGDGERAPPPHPPPSACGGLPRLAPVSAFGRGPGRVEPHRSVPFAVPLARLTTGLWKILRENPWRNPDPFSFLAQDFVSVFFFFFFFFLRRKVLFLRKHEQHCGGPRGGQGKAFRSCELGSLRRRLKRATLSPLAREAPLEKRKKEEAAAAAAAHPAARTRPGGDSGKVFR